MFHPEGSVYRARVEAVPGPFSMLAQRLEGPALARPSTAWWRGGKEWLDALGIAVRLGRDPAPRRGQAIRICSSPHPLSLDDAVRAAHHRAARLPRQRLLRGLTLRRDGRRPREAAPRLLPPPQAGRLDTRRPGGGSGGARRGLASARTADREEGAGGAHRPARASAGRSGAAALPPFPRRQGDLSPRLRPRAAPGNVPPQPGRAPTAFELVSRNETRPGPSRATCNSEKIAM